MKRYLGTDGGKHSLHTIFKFDDLDDDLCGKHQCGYTTDTAIFIETSILPGNWKIREALKQLSIEKFMKPINTLKNLAPMPQVMLSCLQVLHHHASLIVQYSGVMLASVYPCTADQALIMIWLHHAFAGNIDPYVKRYGVVTVRLEGFQSILMLNPVIVAP